ncbi:hypothetical protein SAMN04487910_1094 [Aquimarina amphilecti]|uniref:Uncharacterized protein n=1 Tax=Aquimarina amphilecti TaxID=1038014 RepID=A0A1H7JVQ1_AQUAM|nr:hypothetical protein [Aquimarina amphilecti]SEK77817.1 hypothetical protein SAMN04487910_1094 [Aquimarina amphilecti]
MNSFKINSTSILLITVFVSYYLMYVFLVPTQENPDETRHWRNIFHQDIVFKKTGDGDLYYVFQKQIADLFDLKYDKNLNYLHVKERRNPDFQYFKNVYRYQHNSIFPRSDILIFRLANLIVLIPLFLWFLQKRENRYLFLLALCIPGFVWFLSCLNSDLFNIAMGIVVFNVRKRGLSLLIGLLIFSFFALDRSIILPILAFTFYFIFKRFFQKKTLKIVFWFFLFSSMILFYDLSKYIVSHNFNYEPIKSIFTLSFSFYGLLGNMSIRATFIEYVIFILLMLFLVIKINTIKKGHYKYDEIKDVGNLIAIFFILWFYLLSLVPTWDQGRYFYPIIFYFLFLFRELFIGRRKKFVLKFLLLSLVLNGFMHLKLLYVYFKHINFELI